MALVRFPNNKNYAVLTRDGCNFLYWGGQKLVRHYHNQKFGGKLYISPAWCESPETVGMVKRFLKEYAHISVSGEKAIRKKINSGFIRLL